MAFNKSNFFHIFEIANLKSSPEFQINRFTATKSSYCSLMCLNKWNYNNSYWILCLCIFLLFYPHFKDWTFEFVLNIQCEDKCIFANPGRKTKIIGYGQKSQSFLMTQCRTSLWCCFYFCMTYAHPSFRVWISFAIHI